MDTTQLLYWGVVIVLFVAWGVMEYVKEQRRLNETAASHQDFLDWANELTIVDLTGADSEAADDVDCTACSGMGVMDLCDLDGRPYLFDVECKTCGGTGRIGAES